MASGIEVQEAFRRGASGHPLGSTDADGLAETSAPYAAGLNEQALLALQRLPGLTDAHAAYETGRALRRVMQLFDQAGAPERVGREFLANLGGAVVVDHMRGARRAWGAAETVDMLVELYARILGGREAELDALRRTVMDYAVAESEPQRQPWYRRVPR